jgi:hypothetical protein
LSQPAEEEKAMKYAAHLIMAVKFDDAPQDRYPVYENVVLVEAETDERALEVATEIGRREEQEGSPFRWDGRPARWSFAGVRKLIECQTPGSDDEELRPGTEVTYSQLVLGSEEDLRKLVDGEPVNVLYEE